MGRSIQFLGIAQMVVETKKSLGQHWLHDPASLQAMVDAADVQPGQTVLEIGPGTGTLTEYLLAAGAQVVALEFDQDLLKGLHRRFDGGANFKLVHGDIRTFNFTELPAGYKVVANIPYYLTSHLVQLLSETPNPPVCAVLLIQKEVAERATAKPGNMSLLSITTQFYWEASLGPLVPAELFTPPPKVDSQILILQRRTQQLFPDEEPKDFFRLVKAGFSQKRKTLLNSLSAGLNLDKSRTLALLETAGLAPTLRPQNLGLSDWHSLLRAQAAANR